MSNDVAIKLVGTKNYYHFAIYMNKLCPYAMSLGGFTVRVLRKKWKILSPGCVERLVRMLLACEFEAMDGLIWNTTSRNCCERCS